MHCLLFWLSGRQIHCCQQAVKVTQQLNVQISLFTKKSSQFKVKQKGALLAGASQQRPKKQPFKQVAHTRGLHVADSTVIQVLIRKLMSHLTLEVCIWHLA